MILKGKELKERIYKIKDFLSLLDEFGKRLNFETLMENINDDSYPVYSVGMAIMEKVANVNDLLTELCKLIPDDRIYDTGNSLKVDKEKIERVAKRLTYFIEKDLNL